MFRSTAKDSNQTYCKLAEKEHELEELKRYVADESRKFSEALTLLEHQMNILSIDNGQMEHSWSTVV